MGDFGPEGVCRFASRSLGSVTASGQNRRPAAARSSASTDHPTRSKADLAGTPVHVALGVTVSARNLVRKVQRKISPEPP